MELASIAAAGALVMVLTDLDDDEDNWLNNYMLYQAKRYQTEMLQWQPWFAWKESLRILQSPTATVRPITKGIELVSQVFNEIQYLMGSPFVDESAIFYQRRSGRFKKGDRKIFKDFQDLLPVFRGLQKHLVQKKLTNGLPHLTSGGNKKGATPLSLLHTHF